MRGILVVAFITLVAALMGCVGKTNPLTVESNIPETGSDINLLNETQDQYDTGFPSLLPQDSIDPWDELSPSGYIIPNGNKTPSATNPDSEFFFGTQAETQSGDTTNWNGALRIASGDPGDGELSHAIYRIPLGGNDPGVVSVDANLRPMSDGMLGGYYVGLADYGNGSWQWFGPVTDAHWRISTVQAARESASYTGEFGSVFVCVAAYNGTAMDIVGVGVDVANPSDTIAPDAPPAPTLTPVAGGLLVDWATFAGSDIAGYKLYYRSKPFTDFTAFSAMTLPTLHDSLLRLSLDEYTLQTWWVGLSTVDLSGNESAVGPVVSATPLASEAGVEPLWIEIDNANALLNQAIGMTATGADSFDWDLNGDGVFDVFGDETGTQNIDTSMPGVIRPLVRGSSSGTTYVSLSTISVVVTSNQRPIAMGYADPAFGVAPLTVTFTGLANDFDGLISKVAWDFDGDKSYEFVSETVVNPPPHIFNTPGIYNAKYRVWDDDDSWDVDTVTVHVTGNSPPVANITSVLECQLGEEVTFDAQQSFDLDGTIVQYEWDLDGNGSFEFDSTPTFWAEETFNEPGDTEVGLRVTDDQGAQGTISIMLMVHGSAPVTVDSAGSVGKFSSMSVVNGNPAICYYDATTAELRYVRATDSSGSAWASSVIVDDFTGLGTYPSLAMVNGRPAISYVDFASPAITYVRADDANGDSWGSFSAPGGGYLGSFTSLVVVDGNPAISFYSVALFNLKYVRATDVDGSAWGAVIDVDNIGDVGQYSSMAIVDGRPAISYFNNTSKNLVYQRASDSTGSSWGSKITFLSPVVDGFYTSLAVVNGSPAISYYDATAGELKYVIADDTVGSGWGMSITLDGAGSFTEYTSLTTINGKPAISYTSASNLNLQLILATDAAGSSWDNPLTLDTAGYVGKYSCLAEVHGNPAISYWDESNDDLKYVMLY